MSNKIKDEKIERLIKIYWYIYILILYIIFSILYDHWSSKNFSNFGGQHNATPLPFYFSISSSITNTINIASQATP